MSIIDPSEHFEVKAHNGSLLHATEDVPLQRWIGENDGSEGRWMPSANTVTPDGLLLVMPGVYKPADPSTSATITMENLNDCDIEVIANGQSSQDDLVCDKLATLIELLKASPTFVPGAYETGTGKCYPLATRPRCDGSGEVDCVYFDPEAKDYIMATGNAGINPAAKIADLCVFACQTTEVCNDGAETLTLTVEDIETALVAQGGKYQDGTDIAVSDAMTGFSVELLHMGDEVKKAGEDDPFVTVACDACVYPSAAATGLNMEPGGVEMVGFDYSGQANPNPEQVADIEGPYVEVEPGSAVRIVGYKARCGPEGTAEPLVGTGFGSISLISKTLVKGPTDGPVREIP